MSEYELTDIEKKAVDNWIMLNILPQKTPNQTAGGHPTLKDGVCFGQPARLFW